MKAYMLTEYKLSRDGNVTRKHVTRPHCPCHVRTMQADENKMLNFKVKISFYFAKKPKMTPANIIWKEKKKQHSRVQCHAHYTTI